MKQEDLEKIAFCAPQWLFLFRVMPLGLVMMRMVLDEIDHVDDVLMTWSEHLTTLRAFFV